jgi:hypothetical protein
MILSLVSTISPSRHLESELYSMNMNMVTLNGMGYMTYVVFSCFVGWYVLPPFINIRCFSFVKHITGGKKAFNPGL